MFNKILVKLSLAVVITAMNVSLAFCQIGVVDIVLLQVSGGEEISISPQKSGETEIAIIQNGQVVLETIASKLAVIPLHLAPGVYQIVATHRPSECREVRSLKLED